jgi:hypothetical protein
MNRRFIFLIVACMGLAGCVREPIQKASEERKPIPKADEEGAFPLKEIPLTEAIERCGELAYCGQRVYLGFSKTDYWEDSTIPNKEVKKYPDLKAAKPLYGSVRFGGNYNKPDSGLEYFFVLDSLKSDGYDRLYFDANRDLDLTNDPPLQLSKNAWPAGLWSYQSAKGLQFEELSLPMDFGPGYGMQPVKILPFVFINKDQSEKAVSAVVMFVPSAFREGRIRIADKQYDVMLAQSHFINGRFDSPYTGLYLLLPDKKEVAERWWGADQLGAYRFVEGKYYTISATPIGDKLFVKPYTGELGIIKLGSGGREFKEMTFNGSLRSPASAVAIGNIGEGPDKAWPNPVDQRQVPVGDYTASYLTIHFGPFNIGVSDNYHSDGKPRDSKRQRKFAIQIRKDKPFVLDFSNKPEVLFASPAKDQVFKPGDQLSVKAVLIDPALDIMIRDLDDTREKVKEEIDVGNNQKQTIERQKSLDPIVTITDSAGKTVAKGPMPFG